jgi:hypothetical protein
MAGKELQNRSQHYQETVRRELVGTYVYQLLYQLPQLVLLPALALVLPATEFVAAAKALLAINMIAVVSDWGYSTLGAQRLFQHRDHTAYRSEIFHNGERVRRLVSAVVCVAAVAWVLAQHHGTDIRNLSISISVLGLGTYSAYLVPNWLVVGGRIFEEVLPTLIVVRLVTLSLAVAAASMIGSAMSALLIYYAAVCLGSAAIRRRALQVAAIERAGESRGRMLSELHAGFLLTFGGFLSYSFLNTGVVFVDRYGTPAIAASFVLADRIFAIARAAYAPVVQYLIVEMRPGAINSGRSNKKMVGVLLLASLAVWFTGKGLLIFLYHDSTAERLFRILYVGFLFLGFSHYYVSLKLLGGGHVMRWIVVLSGALGVYLMALALLLGPAKYRADQAAALSVVAAEITVFVLGMVLYKRNNERI